MNIFGLVFGLVFAQVWFLAYLLALWDDCHAIYNRLPTIRSTLDQPQILPNRICHARSQDLQHKVPSSSKTHVYLRLCLLFRKLLTPVEWLVLCKPELCRIEELHLELAALIFSVAIMWLNVLGPGLIGTRSCEAWKRHILYSGWIVFLSTVFVGSLLDFSLQATMCVGFPCALNMGGNLAMAWHQRSDERPCFWKDKGEKDE